MALVKVREYDVEDDNVKENGIGLKLAVPINWLRDHCAAGEKLGVFIDSDNPDRLVITKTPLAVSERPA